MTDEPKTSPADSALSPDAAIDADTTLKYIQLQNGNKVLVTVRKKQAKPIAVVRPKEPTASDTSVQTIIDCVKNTSISPDMVGTSKCQISKEEARKASDRAAAEAASIAASIAKRGKSFGDGGNIQPAFSTICKQKKSRIDSLALGLAKKGKSPEPFGLDKAPKKRSMSPRSSVSPTGSAKPTESYQLPLAFRPKSSPPKVLSAPKNPFKGLSSPVKTPPIPSPLANSQMSLPTGIPEKIGQSSNTPVKKKSVAKAPVVKPKSVKQAAQSMKQPVQSPKQEIKAPVATSSQGTSLGGESPKASAQYQMDALVNAQLAYKIYQDQLAKLGIADPLASLIEQSASTSKPAPTVSTPQSLGNLSKLDPTIQAAALQYMNNQIQGQLANQGLAAQALLAMQLLQQAQQHPAKPKAAPPPQKQKLPAPPKKSPPKPPAPRVNPPKIQPPRTQTIVPKKTMSIGMEPPRKAQSTSAAPKVETQMIKPTKTVSVGRMQSPTVPAHGPARKASPNSTGLPSYVPQEKAAVIPPPSRSMPPPTVPRSQAPTVSTAGNSCRSEVKTESKSIRTSPIGSKPQHQRTKHASGKNSMASKIPPRGAMHVPHCLTREYPAASRAPTVKRIKCVTKAVPIMQMSTSEKGKQEGSKAKGGSKKSSQSNKSSPRGSAPPENRNRSSSSNASHDSSHPPPSHQHQQPIFSAIASLKTKVTFQLTVPRDTADAIRNVTKGEERIIKLHADERMTLELTVDEESNAAELLNQLIDNSEYNVVKVRTIAPVPPPKRQPVKRPSSGQANAANRPPPTLPYAKKNGPPSPSKTGSPRKETSCNTPNVVLPKPAQPSPTAGAATLVRKIGKPIKLDTLKTPPKPKVEDSPNPFHSKNPTGPTQPAKKPAQKALKPPRPKKKPKLDNLDGLETPNPRPTSSVTPPVSKPAPKPLRTPPTPAGRKGPRNPFGDLLKKPIKTEPVEKLVPVDAGPDFDETPPTVKMTPPAGSAVRKRHGSGLSNSSSDSIPNAVKRLLNSDGFRGDYVPPGRTRHRSAESTRSRPSSSREVSPNAPKQDADWFSPPRNISVKRTLPTHISPLSSTTKNRELRRLQDTNEFKQAPISKRVAAPITIKDEIKPTKRVKREHSSSPVFKPTILSSDRARQSKAPLTDEDEVKASSQRQAYGFDQAWLRKLSIPTIKYNNRVRSSSGSEWRPSGKPELKLVNDAAAGEHPTLHWVFESIVRPGCSNENCSELRRGDTIIVKAGPDEPPFIGMIQALWSDSSYSNSDLKVGLLWYYRAADMLLENSELENNTSFISHDGAVYASKHFDTISAASIEDKCYVLTVNEYALYRKRCRLISQRLCASNQVDYKDSDVIKIELNRESDTQVVDCEDVPDFAVRSQPRPRRCGGNPMKSNVYFCPGMWDVKTKAIKTSITGPTALMI